MHRINLDKTLLNNWLIIFLFITGFILRLWFSFSPGFKFDVDAWFAWALRLNQTGFANFYSDQIWTNYTPGFLYILGFLGSIKSLFQIGDNTFYLILKIPSIIAELILGLFIYQQIVKKSLIWALIAVILILFNPAFIFNSSVWGQIDGLLSLVLVFSIYFLSQQKLVLSSIFLGLGFLIKPQAIAVLPIFALFLAKNLSIRNFFRIAIPSLSIILLLSLPFFINQPFSGIIKLFSKMVSDYPFTSLFAYNLWGIVGFWIPDNQLWNGLLPYQNLGYILFAGFWIIAGYLYFKKKLSIYALTSLAVLSFYFLPTRVHERYLYPALVFLILLTAINKSKLLLVLTGLLTLLHFLNLYYVYIYYNELYLNLPKIFYNPVLYNFLASNSKSLSFISIIIFILISLGIIKYHAISQKH